jgi:hypothetical protein
MLKKFYEIDPILVPAAAKYYIWVKMITILSTLLIKVVHVPCFKTKVCHIFIFAITQFCPNLKLVSY